MGRRALTETRDEPHTHHNTRTPQLIMRMNALTHRFDIHTLNKTSASRVFSMPARAQREFANFRAIIALTAFTVMVFAVYSDTVW